MTLLNVYSRSMSNEKIRELEKQIDRFKAEGIVSEAFVDTLINLGYAYSFTDPDKSTSYGEQAREMAQSIQYPIGLCRSYNVT